MLRRRIFSSAMASVMALSTVAVVAQAEETKAVKTEAELDALVNGEAEGQCGSAWRSGELLDYGATQTEQMLDALDAAEAVLNNDEATEDDYTVAWYMVTGVRESLSKYTYDDLQKLIKKAEPKFAKNNIYNEELNDNIYAVDKYAALESAYGEALGFSENSLVPDITDAYKALEKALNELAELPKVTKAEFRAVMNEYEAILADAYKYDSWRRGTTSGGNWTQRGNGAEASFAYIYDTVYAAKDDITFEYDKLDAIKGLNVTTDVDIRAGYDLAKKAIDCFKAWTPDADVRGSAASVKSLINKYNGVLVHDFMSDVMGDESTSADDTTLIGSIAATGAAITYYADNGAKLWSETYSAGFGYDLSTTADGWCNGILIGATAVVSLDKPVYIPVDKDGKWVTSADVKGAKPTKATADGAGYDKGDWILEGAKVAGTEVVSYKMLSAKSKFDLANYVKVEVNANNYDKAPDAFNRTLDAATDKRSGRVAWENWSLFYNLNSDGVETTKIDLATALVIAQAYMEGTYANINPSSSDKNTLAKEKAQAAAFDKYITATAPAGVLETVVAAAADTNGLTANLSGVKGVADNDANRPENDPDDLAASNDIIDVIDETGAVATVKDEGDNGKARGHYTEWTLVYRYLQYALADCYDASAQSEGAKYTMADVNNLIAKATQLIDDTGDAAIFNPSNVALVNARQVAREWLADAKSDKLYKDYTKGVGADGDEYVDSTAAYTALFAAYDALDEEYAALNLSFEDVYAKIAETTAAIDKGDLDDSADLQDAIKAVARALSNIDDITYAYDLTIENNGRPKADDSKAPSLEYEDNAAFDGFREFLSVNRVVTGRGQIAAMNGYSIDCNSKQNPTHKALVDALAALDKAIEKASEPEVVVVAGDYTGEGKVSLADAAAILTDYTAGTLDQTKGDYNGDGKTSLADAAAILTAFTNGEL